MREHYGSLSRDGHVAYNKNIIIIIIIIIIITTIRMLHKSVVPGIESPNEWLSFIVYNR